MGLTSERGAFLRSASINVVGQMAPLIAAVITIPPLLSVLGADRFGLLMLFMVAVGYFGLLDIGIAKAVTRRIAQLGVEAGPADRSVIIGSALVLLLAISLLTAGFLIAMSGQIVSAVGATPELSAELQGALRLVALCIPIILMGQAFRGCLEGLNRFDLVNLITVPASVATYVLAYGGAFLGADLRYVVMGVCLSRVLGAFAFLAAYRALHTGLQVKLAASKSEATQLLRFGGWASVSSIIGPAIVFMDRFAIAILLGPAAAAIYSTVQEIMYRILIVPSAVTAVTFPAYIRAAGHDGTRATDIITTSFLAIFFILAPVSLGAVSVGAPLLEVWLGGTVDDTSRIVIGLLAGVVLINGVAQVPFAVIQAAGRADLTAKLHTVEFFILALAMWLLVPKFGVEGAAWASFGRVVFDLLVLLGASLTVCRIPLAVLGRIAGLVAAVLVAMYAISFSAGTGYRAAQGMLFVVIVVALAARLFQIDFRQVFREFAGRN